MKRLVCLLLVFLSSQQLPARDLFVNNVVGNDEFTGLSESPYGADGPTRTIGHALQLTVSGDRLIIVNTGQPYRESVTLVGSRNSGFESLPFVIEGNGAVLDGRTAIPANLWVHRRADLWSFRPHRTASLLLYLWDRPAQFRPVPPDGRMPQLAPLEWTIADGSVWFCVEPGRYPDQYPLTVTLYSVGITLYDVENVAIANLIVQGYQLDGINVFDRVRDCRLIDITCRGNGRSGVAIANASRATLDGCLVGDNGIAQLWTEGYSRGRLVDTALVDNSAPAYRHRGSALLIDDVPIKPGTAP